MASIRTLGVVFALPGGGTFAKMAFMAGFSLPTTTRTSTITTVVSESRCTSCTDIGGRFAIHGILAGLMRRSRNYKNEKWSASS